MRKKIIIVIVGIAALGIGLFILNKLMNPETGNPGNFLVLSSKTIPEGFKGSIRYLSDPNAGYGGQYDNTNDINGNGNPAQIFITAQVNSGDSDYENTLKYYKDLSTRENKEIKEFDYNGLHGFVFDSTTYPGNIDHTLVVKDGPRFYKIFTRDGTKNKFSTDDLITLFKTLEGKPVTSSIAGNDAVNPSQKIIVTEPISDTDQKSNIGSLNELTTSVAVIDPEVVTGYVWSSSKESPNFSSVTLPIWGISQDKDFMQREYTIDIWDGKGFVFYTKASPLKEVVFPDGGVYKFRVQGINPDYAICPGDRSLYTWGVKFVTAGTFNGERIPITADVSSQGKKCQVRH